MSGICGLFNLDNAPVAAAELRAMTSLLERRGPDRTGRWCDGPIGLGHTMLGTTPELLYENQPFRHAESGCVITADVRLDNRDELLGILGLSDKRDSVGDAELILQTYLRWSDECVKHLLGDFAFAIRDPRHQKLFCARDHFGLRPFYYHNVPGQRFVFASDARAILVLPQVPYRINAGRVADFLVKHLEWIDYTSTFYAGVSRLPPGHRATATPNSLNVVEYWKPQPAPEPGHMSDDDYQQGFLDVFTAAVRSRLRSPEASVGSMLSGGVDSGSVVAVAKDILNTRGDKPLATYSAVRQRGTDCAESRAIHATASMPLISPKLIFPESLRDDIPRLTSGFEEPFDGELMIQKTVYLAAHRQGHRTVLDGAGGDVVLHEGSYLVRLIRSGQLELAIKEISAQNNIWGETSLSRDLLRYTRSAFTPASVKKLLRPIRDGMSKTALLDESLISREFAESINLEDRCSRYRRMFPDNWTPDYASECSNLIRPNVTGGRERYGRLAATAGVEACDPFLDKRVVDFCTRLPAHLRMQDGWRKRILRDVMADHLPEEVCWAKGKPHLGWFFNETVTKMAFDRNDLDVERLQKTLEGFVDPSALRDAWQDFQQGVDAERIHTALILSKWLVETAHRPVVAA